VHRAAWPSFLFSFSGRWGIYHLSGFWYFRICYLRYESADAINFTLFSLLWNGAVNNSRKSNVGTLFIPSSCILNSRCHACPNRWQNFNLHNINIDHCILFRKVDEKISPYSLRMHSSWLSLQVKAVQDYCKAIFRSDESRAYWIWKWPKKNISIAVFGV